MVDVNGDRSAAPSVRALPWLIAEAGARAWALVEFDWGWGRGWSWMGVAVWIHNITPQSDRSPFTGY